MGRSEQKNLNQNAGIARSDSAQFGGQANSIYSTLAPTLTAEATNPQGFAPDDLAAMNTANQQSIGGATAGVIGQGNLTAARTRNAGGFAAALDEGAREGGRTLSQNAVDIQSKNAALREANRQAGIRGLQGLYGGLTADQLQALGLSNQAYSGASNAAGPGFFDYWKQLSQNANSAAAAGGE